MKAECRKIRVSVLVFASSLFAFPAIAQTAESGSQGKPGREAILKFSEDGNTALRDIEAARLAIFSSDPKTVLALIADARNEIGKAEKAGASAFAKGSATASGTVTMPMIPVDGQLVVKDDFVPTAEKEAHIAEADQNIDKGNHQQALKELHLGEIEVIYNRLWMPVARTYKHLDQATQLIDAHKYYQANLALKAIGGSLSMESVALTETPAKQKGTKKAEQ